MRYFRGYGEPYCFKATAGSLTIRVPVRFNAGATVGDSLLRIWVAVRGAA